MVCRLIFRAERSENWNCTSAFAGLARQTILVMKPRGLSFLFSLWLSKGMAWVKTHPELTEAGDKGEYQFLSWNILFILDNVYKGFRLLFVSRSSLRSFRPRAAGLHKAIVLIYWVGLFVPPWMLVISVSRTSLMAGADPHRFPLFYGNRSDIS